MGGGAGSGKGHVQGQGNEGVDRGEGSGDVPLVQCRKDPGVEDQQCARLSRKDPGFVTIEWGKCFRRT